MAGARNRSAERAPVYLTSGSYCVPKKSAIGAALERGDNFSLKMNLGDNDAERNVWASFSDQFTQTLGVSPGHSAINPRYNFTVAWHGLTGTVAWQSTPDGENSYLCSAALQRRGR